MKWIQITTLLALLVNLGFLFSIMHMQTEALKNQNAAIAELTQRVRVLEYATSSHL